MLLLQESVHIFLSTLVKRIIRKKEDQICTRSESFLDQLAYSKLQSNTSGVVPLLLAFMLSVDL